MSVNVCRFTSFIWDANQQFYATLYFHVRSVILYNTLSHIFSQTERFSEKKCTEYKTKVSIFTKFLSDNSPILRNIQQCVIINIQRSTCKSSTILVEF